MVINLSRCLTLSVSVVALSAIPVSAAYLNHDTRLSKSSMIDTNTHTLKSSAQSSAFIKTASVCFITDINDCQGGEFSGSGSVPEYDPDPDNRCKKEGYTKITCNSMEVPSSKCPYDETYIEECKCKSSLVECNAPNIGVGEACGGKFESCCNDKCSSGYDLSNGDCRQASALKTACGNACYKILSNNCSTGSLNPPAETGENRNKVVATTECGNSCWQNFNDNCAAGYVKEKAGGKCYETTVSYTPYGSACYKEKPCCDDTCSGYSKIPTRAQCSVEYGMLDIYYNFTQTGCGKDCYTCKPCAQRCNLRPCPANGNCTIESCSGKYCLDSCKAGYKKSGNVCVSATKNGVVGDYYYCNDAITGVVIPEIRIIIALNDAYQSDFVIDSSGNKTEMRRTYTLPWNVHQRLVSQYLFCDLKGGRFPTQDEMLLIINKSSTLDGLLNSAGGVGLEKTNKPNYWTSTLASGTYCGSISHSICFNQRNPSCGCVNNGNSDGTDNRSRPVLSY